MGMIHQMSSKLMVLWAIIIVSILSCVCVIGFNEKDKGYMKVEHNIRLASRAYIKDNNIKVDINDSFVIFTKDLKNIKQEDIDEYCINEIIYYKGILFDKYTIVKDCNSNN